MKFLWIILIGFILLSCTKDNSNVTANPKLTEGALTPSVDNLIKIDQNIFRSLPQNPMEAEKKFGFVFKKKNMPTSNEEPIVRLGYNLEEIFETKNSKIVFWIDSSGKKKPLIWSFATKESNWVIFEKNVIGMSMGEIQRLFGNTNEADKKYLLYRESGFWFSFNFVNGFVESINFGCEI